jgi:hypothetical protein
MKKSACIAIWCLICIATLSAAPGPQDSAGGKKDSVETATTGAAAPSGAAAQGGAAYRIDKPGTITFTVGVKIKGKVEKPQVMIFLPKEKPFYQKATFSYSFIDDIMKPLPFAPVEK